jgi:hypothetical protein
MVYSGSPESSVITYIKGVDRKNPGLFGKHRQKLITQCNNGDLLKLVREPNNPVDTNAIKVCNWKKQQLGYLSRYVASKVAPLLDSGKNVEAEIREIRGSKKHYDCLIEITAENIVWDKDRNPLDMSKPGDLGLKEIGLVDAICPYCSFALEKKPGRKKKCPDCGSFIYVRTRPIDRERVLVTEAQIAEIDRQWEIMSGR